MTSQDVTVFGGAKAWYCVLPRADKLEPRAREARMVGYASAGYRLWDLKSDKIVISRDVSFDEMQFLYSPTKVIQQIEYTSENETEEVHSEIGEVQEKAERIEQGRSDNTHKRIIKTPKYLENYEVYAAYCLYGETIGPSTYKEAIESTEWQEAIQNEVTTLEEIRDLERYEK